MTRYFKILVDGKSCHGGKSTWNLPKDGKPGKWMPAIKGELIPCTVGYHIVQSHQLPQWLKENCQIFEVEVSGDVIDADDKSVCRKVRLIKQTKYDPEVTPRLFAADCAEHVLHIFEKEYPGDDRPRKAIEAARKFAKKEIDAAAMAAARAAAWAAEQQWHGERLLKYLDGEVE